MTIAQGFPKLNAALVNQQNGQVTQPWLQFFISLWIRTGSGLPSGQVTSVNVGGNNGITALVVDPTTNVQITLGLGSITPTSVTASGAVVGSNLSGSNTGDVTVVGQNYLTMIGQVITANPVNLSTSNVTGFLASTSFPALSGDISNSAGTTTMALSAGAVITTSIANNAVTPAKIANGTNNTLAGYSNTGVFSTVTTGAQLSLTGGTLNTTGISATITTAKLTTGGANGSMTFTNGVLTAQTQAT